jgi:hypothetical protein
VDLWPLTAVGLSATAAVWVVTIVARPNVRPIALRGLLVAVLAGIIVGLAAGALAIAFLNSPDTARILGPLGLGMVVFVVVGGGFLWLNLVVLTIGLWFRPERSWAIGACLATPVVLAAIGFGYAAYRAWPL